MKIGQETEFGKTARLIQQKKPTASFVKTVLHVGNALLLLSVVLVVIVVIHAIVVGTPWLEAVVFSLVLLVAAVLAALPVVLSVTMALGAHAWEDSRGVATTKPMSAALQRVLRDDRCTFKRYTARVYSFLHRAAHRPTDTSSVVAV